MDETREPFAFVIQKDTFLEYSSENCEDERLSLKRRSCYSFLAASLIEKDIIISTTGSIT